MTEVVSARRTAVVDRNVSDVELLHLVHAE